MGDVCYEVYRIRSINCVVAGLYSVVEEPEEPRGPSKASCKSLVLAVIELKTLLFHLDSVFCAVYLHPSQLCLFRDIHSCLTYLAVYFFLSKPFFPLFLLPMMFCVLCISPWQY